MLSDIEIAQNAKMKKINEIADKLGYQDLQYFYRFFKKNAGQTPGAFRKNALAQTSPSPAPHSA